MGSDFRVSFLFKKMFLSLEVVEKMRKGVIIRICSLFQKCGKSTLNVDAQNAGARNIDIQDIAIEEIEEIAGEDIPVSAYAEETVMSASYQASSGETRTEIQSQWKKIK